jgi:hypothetical protein
MENSLSILKQSANNLASKSWWFTARSFFAPIDYTRTRELPKLIEISDILKYKDKKLKILDISSPQILSMSLAQFAPQWNITYINPFAPELENMEKRVALLNLRNIQIMPSDITEKDIHQKLSGFDMIFSCSVFEHIYPEAGGDVMASANIRNLLKIGGKFVFSVPFYKKGFHEYKKYGEYGNLNETGEGAQFFQRFYDQNTLENQILLPTKLTVENIVYIGERFFFPNNIRIRFSRLVSGRYPTLLLGRLFPLLSKIFMFDASDPNRIKKPYLALVSMVKGA